MSGTYSDLEVWQSAMDFAVRIYRLTKGYPREETYGLTIQLRRAAVSVASNIAEGKGRSSDKELAQFLCHSRGSLFEIETQLAIAKALGYGNQEEYAALKNDAAKIGRMLNGLMRSVAPTDKALKSHCGR
jgi:four helix bundle protein